MMQLNLGLRGSEHLKVLCLGAHSDDIEIGCGGTLLQLAQGGREVSFHWVVFTAGCQRAEEARTAAARITGGCETTLVLKDFKDGFLPYNGALVKESFEELKKAINPDLIFTHWRGDAHQDHRLISELTWNTFRNHLILEYEIPKYDGDLGKPNVFVPIGDADRLKKVEILCDSFGSQRSKAWFTPETFFGLMRLRGMESNAPSGYAEAFHARKVLIDSAI
jgi:LmbE family N-acetylglucosaminyl deacetylase